MNEAQGRSNTAEVLVIGAGLAGLSAAVALSAAGARVTLLERKPYVGGRAYSYPHPALGEVVDSQHALMGCYTNMRDLCERCGAAPHIRWYDAITFLEPGREATGAQRARPPRASILQPGRLPSPGHSSLSLLRAPMLSFADKARIALGLLDFLHGYPASDAEPFSAWLERTGQSESAIRHFWEPVVLGALNDSFERCSTRYAGQVFHEAFLKSGEAARLGIPTQPLSAFCAMAAELAQKQGTDVQLRASVEQLVHRRDGMWQASTSDGRTFCAERVVLALPFEQAARLLAAMPAEEPVRRAVLPLTTHFEHAPITTLHLWFDRDVTGLDHAALLDTRIQWMFNKTRIRRAEAHSIQIAAEGEALAFNREQTSALPRSAHYVELVISASFAELNQGREPILSAALAELERFFPEVRGARLLKSGILKEARATFSVLPGLDRYRPAPDLCAEQNLFLAGDWVRTGWPSVMEGAVRSGRLAAEALVSAAGQPQKFLAPDLPARGLMRLWSHD